MQVKVNTGEKVYRFNQRGQLIDTITEPYVSVDTRTLEDLEALYDSFTSGIATRLPRGELHHRPSRSGHANAIQNFLLVEGAWYLHDLEDPSTDLEIKSEAEGDRPLHAETTWMSRRPPRPQPAMNPNFRSSYLTPTSARS